MVSRDRYLSSLESIQEIVDIVSEPIATLDKESKYTITVSSDDIEDSGVDTAKAVQAIVNWFKSMKAIIGEHPENPDARTETGSPSSKDREEGTEKSDADKGDRRTTSTGLLIAGVIARAVPEAMEGVGAHSAEEARRAEVAQIFERLEREMPDHFDPSMIGNLVRIEPPRRKEGMLLASLLTAAVSDFEVLFASIVGYFYRVHPEALRSQDSPIPWSEIEQYTTIDDLKSYYIDARVSKLMWQGFEDWMKWAEQQLKIRFHDAALDPDGTTEVFQRRHVIIHNGGRASRQYLAKTSGLARVPALDEELRVDRAYLTNSIDKLSVLGISLAHLSMRKLCKGQNNHERVDQDINKLVFRLLGQKHWKVAEKVASIALPHMTVEAERLALKVNKWIAQERTEGREAIIKEVSSWDVSALSDRFKLARVALLDDPSAVDIAKRMLEEGSLTFEELSTWQLLEKVYPGVDFQGMTDPDGPTQPDGAAKFED
jgi:hypothetical protein